MSLSEDITAREIGGIKIPSFRESLEQSTIAKAWLDFSTGDDIPREGDDKVQLFREAITADLIKHRSTSKDRQREARKALAKARFEVSASPALQHITGEKIYIPSFIFPTRAEYIDFEKLTLLKPDPGNSSGTCGSVKARDVQTASQLKVSDQDFPLSVVFSIEEKDPESYKDPAQQRLHEEVHAIDILKLFRDEGENGVLLSEIIAFIGEHSGTATESAKNISALSSESLAHYIVNPRSEALLALSKRKSKVLNLLEEGKEEKAKEEIMDGLEGLISILTNKFPNADILKQLLVCQSFSEVYLLARKLLPSLFTESMEDILISDTRSNIGDLGNIGVNFRSKGN